MLDKIFFYLQFPFVRYSLIVGIMISLSSSLLGVTLVLKRFSYIGDGLSHVAFGAMAIATILKLTDKMILILPVTVICAILLLKTGQNAKIKGDAAIAMLSVGALAFGYLIKHRPPPYWQNVVPEHLSDNRFLFRKRPFPQYAEYGLNKIMQH